MALHPQAVERPWVRFYDDGVPAQLTYPDLLLHQVLEESARRHRRLTALLFFGRRMTYAELDALVARFAAGLQRLGVRQGTPVSLHLPNCPQFVIAYYGILKAGGVAVPHNPLYTEREIEYQLRDAGVEVAVTLTQFYPRVAAAAQRVGVRHVIYTPIHQYMPPHLRLLYPLKARREGQWVQVRPAPGVLPFAALLAEGRPQPVTVSPDDPALYQYTGGTTGVPKAAVLTHRNLVANLLQAVAWYGGGEHAGQRAMAVLPFFHIYGMTAVLNFSLRLGMTIILIPRFDPEMVLRAIDRWRPTVFHGVPTMYASLLNHPRLVRTDMRSIRTCISGAMGLPQEVQRRWEAATGGRLVEGYGLTEASPITHCTPVYGHRRVGSIGVPFPDTDARVVDAESGRVLSPGEVGELAVRGPQVMRGYLNRPEETAAALREGWLLTGDMARMDEDGFFYIVDRKKEMINVGGLKVFPREVEEVLYEHAAVREAAVIPAPDPLKGEVVKAYVALKTGATATTDELIAFCRQRLAPHKVPRAVEFRDALPKTLIGKILRRALLEEERRGVT
ncbi:MAG: long-chain fatty acid--CoA ligase [Armatimonadota bacterium]|nr:long-chain fatty acid--CoA ligase [Armatimonadota bacterium]MDR7463277.1 long-chain fatty acid--CoA ligase [Armatimonadota bacterium]MDR7470977.1 long-chain fatty acid--CoA ligase [Armatimonadota bacterium]MDR7474715.1 long-chain fatty acid--CoA ligase [Armatimonadota bacterium]MDR7538653.1 long-chain fatty acid--CoA ligase [Armatimonadota bacterium]